jgi:uncharacterized protein YjbI with pentapeptide repeats
VNRTSNKIRWRASSTNPLQPPSFNNTITSPQYQPQHQPQHYSKMETLTDVTLSNSTLTSVTLHKPALASCTLTNLVIRDSTISASLLTNCQILSCTLKASCRVQASKLEKCKIYGVKGFEGCEFHGCEILPTY